MCVISPAGGEVDVGLVGGLEVAAPRDRRLDHAALDGGRALLGAGGGRRADDEHRDDDRRGRQRRERQGGEGGPACHLSSRSCSSVPWPPPWGGCPFGGRPRKVTPHFCSAARSFWNCAESGRGLRRPWPEGGWPFWLDGGWPLWPLWPPGGPPLAPRGRLGTVTPSFFRHATTFGSCRKPRRPPPGWVAPALALLVVLELELPQAARQRAMRRAPTAAQAGREVLTSRQ